MKIAGLKKKILYLSRKWNKNIFYFCFVKIKSVRDESMAGKINEVWQCIWHDDRVVWGL